MGKSAAVIGPADDEAAAHTKIYRKRKIKSKKMKISSSST